MGATALADRIILKDGTVEESKRIWESEHYVHFILKGTQAVEIRYAKSIVSRIECSQAGALPIPPQKPAVEKPSDDKSIPPAPARMTEAERRKIDSLKGTVFYDPRRPKRYWAGADSQHTTLQGAVEALCRQYGQSAQWVLDQIGEENDLARIHHKLYIASRGETATPANTGEAPPPAPAPSKALPTPERTTVKGDPVSDPSIPMSPKGVQFYDPRRPEKYWISTDHRYHSLKDAVNALAELYHRPADWVEQHMGSSNELSDIHQNLKNQLSRPEKAPTE